MVACRRLLIFPKGNETQRGNDHVAVYLDFPEASYTPQHMCPKARFELVAVNQLDNARSMKRGEVLVVSVRVNNLLPFLKLGSILNPMKKT